MSDIFILANESLRLEVDSGTGAIVGLTAIETGWRILDRPHLGLSFRLMVPTRDMADWHVGGRRNNQVLGERQRLTQLEIAPDGRAATLTWDGVVSELAGPLDIRVVLRIDLDDRRAVFQVTIDNRSPYRVESVHCPYLGDVRPPDGAEWLRAFSRNAYAGVREWNLWPQYNFLVGGSFGVDVPTQFSGWNPAAGAPMNPFILLRTGDQGLYAGIASADTELVAWHTELHPGFDSSIDERVPAGREIAGRDVATRFAAVHIPHVEPGETRTLPSVALEAYRGTWHAGADLYKRWRASWLVEAIQPAWIRDPNAWQQVHLNSPEDELRIRYVDLVSFGEDCARNGVQALQITGWNDGGQDQNNPSHDHDPRLGTLEELRDAVAAIKAMGVKVIIFTKFTWADRATRRYREDLRRLAIKDPYGDEYVYGGYNYQTPLQLLDINTKRLVPMCFLTEEWLRVCEAEFAKVLALEPDGILFDECQHHMPALQCFDESHGHRYGAFVYANDRELINRLARMAHAMNTEFLFAGEDVYDWELEAYQHSYLRSEDPAYVPLIRYLLPQASIMTALNGFDDRNMANQCLLYRYGISYEPLNFKGRLEDFPATLAYGKAMDALRTELRAWFWDGEFRDTLGATVRVNGSAHHPYAVYRHVDTGRPGLVIANYADTPVTAQVTVDDGPVPARWRLVDDPTWHPTEGGVVIPPRSAAVLVD